ncbi:MAG: SGNH/GDSL hydrolase family protein, partial [Clostridia bacterium]|nr:SGNH/GDSL hydrolase family protein [Clostridia bacterium]
YSFDVTVDGKYIGSIDNYGDTVFEGNYSKIELPLNDFDKTITLGEGKKTVEIYFPYTVKVNLKEVSVSDGAFVEPALKQDKMLMFGDSITQGYDSLRNIHHYTAQLGNALGLEIVNKGIGGEVFKPELARCKEPYDPKIVTIAYGTNDWSKSSPEIFERDCREFYKTVSEIYPNAKIFGITPPWNKNFDNTEKAMTFKELSDKIERLTSNLENVTIIRGDNLIPHDEKYFGDLFVHPNNEGFDHYFKNLYNEIKKYF